MTSGEHDLSDDLVAYYRQVLITHTTKPEVGACVVCSIPRCPDWLHAFDTLAAAGQVMTASPTAWEPFRPRPRRKR